MNERYEKARRLMNNDDFESAIKLFEAELKTEPHFKDLELLGECLMRLGRLSEAIIPLAAASTLNKGVRAPSLLAETFFLLSEMQKANEVAEIALERDPNNRKAQEIKWRTAK